MTNSVFLNKNRILKLLLISLFLLQTAISFSAREYANNSVLSSGKWVKIKIQETGIYKLTYEDIKAMGFENPENIQVFGYGGHIQSENFALEEYIDDLPQVAIWMSTPKESFGKDDYILFYGKGTIKWTYDVVNNEFRHVQNPYSIEAFYFLTENTDSKIATIQIASPDENAIKITTYQDYYLHEKELKNISQTGRNFYGEDFKNETTQTFDFHLPGITNDNALISYEFVSLPKSKSGTLKTSVNDKGTRTRIISKPSSSFAVANLLKDSFNQTLAEDNKITFQYIQGEDDHKNMHLDYFRVNYTRDLQAYGAVTLFRTTKLTTSNLNYSISNPPKNSVVFDVTDVSNMKQIEGEFNNNTFDFSASNRNIKEYALVDLSQDIPKPTYIGDVKNQDLHSLDSKEMVIIVQPGLRPYAEQLAKIHFDDSGLESLIVYPEEIYNEFSSGTPDATAYRSFLKMLYDKSSVQNNLKYLLLFGDGTYDNRLIEEQWKNIDTKNLLLTYQSENSISEVESYVSDDYFGFLNDHEGNSLRDDKLDIGIGRLPIRNANEASNVVRKIEKYLTDTQPGDWQNNIVFIADDAIAGSSSSPTSERVHVEDSDLFTSYLNKNHPDFRTTKIYMDSYKRTKLTTEQIRHPEAKKVFLENLNSGALIVNYVGHGSLNDWAHEFILTGEDVENMNNKQLPLWITATCDFSRFDNDATSAGEMAVLNPNGGAIALFSTVRVVYSLSNKYINSELFNQVFSEEDGTPLRLGDIIKNAKTNPGPSNADFLLKDGNKLRFLLIGDPALRLNYPSSKYSVSLETINDINVSKEIIQLNALSEVKMKGSIVNSKGSIVNSKGSIQRDFNGTLDITMYDNEQKLTTRGQVKENSSIKPDQIAFKYSDYTNKVYSGKATITKGEFEFSFIAPKDISYTGEKGKAFFIAHDPSNKYSAKGHFSNYKMIGSNLGNNKETTPPNIEKLYLNNESFISGQIISNESTLYAKISDNFGLSLVSDLGHGISATINGTVYDITNYFTSDSESSKSGIIKFTLPDLPEGPYSLTLKIWDIWGNSTSKTIDFIIEEDNQNYTFDLENRATSSELNFIFTNENKDSKITLNYKVYDKAGNIKWTHEEKGKAHLFNNHTHKWDLIGDNGKKLEPDVYKCVVIIKIGSLEDEKTYDFIVL